MLKSYLIIKITGARCYWQLQVNNGNKGRIMAKKVKWQ
jgi:hypothetical protein